MQLGLENKKQAMWAAVLGVLAIIAMLYEVVPFFTGAPSEPASSAQAAAPATRVSARTGGKAAKKVKIENLDPTLRLDLLAASEETVYQGNGRNIFVSHPEDVAIPTVIAKANTDPADHPYVAPPPPAPTPIPLKFFGFASKPGEPKKIFLSLGDELFVAGEGEIVNRRYKVIRINSNSVEMQDVVNSGPPQNIQLSQG